MRRLWIPIAASVVLAACGGGGDRTAPTTTTTAVAAGAPTSTAQPAIEGVRTFAVGEATHTLASVTYPQVPPVGGPHHPAAVRCGYYNEPVPTEGAVHSLEHGAIWVTYRPDLEPAEIRVLADLARSRGSVLVSPWAEGLPAPVVASAWGLQLQLQSPRDPRLGQFVDAYANQGPERNIGC
ncbi:MAG: DUF3105 domain-containing protein [Actinomycetota bacterium]|nr:DUF3105 domain-containing protein [Actinomycetota bacterium]